jgi:hypothetical protein
MSECLSACLSACLFVCLSDCLSVSVCLFVLSVEQSIYLSATRTIDEAACLQRTLMRGSPFTSTSLYTPPSAGCAWHVTKLVPMPKQSMSCPCSFNEYSTCVNAIQCSWIAVAVDMKNHRGSGVWTHARAAMQPSSDESTHEMSTPYACSRHSHHSHYNTERRGDVHPR